MTFELPSVSLSLSLYLISSLDITREFLEWTKDAEILLGLEIFTDWTREYKFCGAKLEGGCCCTLQRKKYNLTRTLDGV